jgi:hypothetical protein
MRPIKGMAIIVGVSAAYGCSAAPAETVTASASSATSAPSTCDPIPSGLFTPSHPQLGRYEVCATAESLTVVANQWAIDWKMDTLDPLDAFGTAGAYDRSAVARLYGGRRAVVARSWLQENGRFEALTLISPHPDAMLRALDPGTLIIRYIVSEP